MQTKTTHVAFLILALLFSGCEYADRDSSAYPMQFMEMRQFTSSASDIYNLQGDSLDDDRVFVAYFADIEISRESYVQIEDPEDGSTIKRYNFTLPKVAAQLDSIPSMLSAFYHYNDHPTFAYTLMTEDSLFVNLLDIHEMSQSRICAVTSGPHYQTFFSLMQVYSTEGDVLPYLALQYHHGNFNNRLRIYECEPEQRTVFDIPEGPPHVCFIREDSYGIHNSSYLATTNAPSHGVRCNGLVDTHSWIVSIDQQGQYNWTVDLGKGGGGAAICTLDGRLLVTRNVVAFTEEPHVTIYELSAATGDTTRLKHLRGKLNFMPGLTRTVDHLIWLTEDQRMVRLDANLDSVDTSLPMAPVGFLCQIGLLNQKAELESFYIYSSTDGTWILDADLEQVSYTPLICRHSWFIGHPARAIQGRFLPMRTSDGISQLVELEWKPWWVWWTARYQEPLLYSTGTPVVLALFLLGFRYVRLRRRSRRELEILSRRLELLSRDVFRKEDQHGKNLARRLHDDIGQDLTALKFAVSTESSSQSIPDTQLLGAMIDALIERVRQISSNIRPPILTKSIDRILIHLAHDHTLHYQMPCHVEVDPHLSLSEETRSVLFHVAKEALANVVRHAKATETWLICQLLDGMLIFEISDDGCGIPKEAFDRVDAIGLAGMRERAGSIGGTINFIPRKGEGTTIHLEIPTNRLNNSGDLDGDRA